MFNLSVSYDFSSKSVGTGAGVAAAVLFALYFLIVFEVTQHFLQRNKLFQFVIKQCYKLIKILNFFRSCIEHLQHIQHQLCL